MQQDLRKLTSFIFVLGASLSMAACSGGDSARATVDRYFAAARKMDGQTMSEQILPANAEAVESARELLAEDGDEYLAVFADYLKGNAAKMTYEIKDVKEDGDKAQATVEARYVNGGPLIQATLGEAIGKMFASAFSGEQPTQEETNQLFSEIMKDKQQALEETFLTKTITIDLLRQDDAWYIEEVTDDMTDVITSGFLSVFDGMDEIFGQ